MWLRNQNIDLFVTWVENTEVPMIVSGPKGEIYWANKSFEEFSGYTSWELSNRLSWEKLSFNDDNLEADKQLITECISGDRINYSIKKQFSPKGEKPVWVDIHVCRFPMSGEFKFFLITVQPLKNGTAAAFSLAIDTINNFSKKLEDYNKEVSGMSEEIVKGIKSSQTKGEEIGKSLGGLAWEYPRITGIVLAIMLAMLLGNQFMEAVKNVKTLFGF